MIADGAEQDRQGGQALLAVNHQELVDPGRAVARTRCQSNGSNEMGRTWGINPVLGQLEDVLPEPLELVLRPRVGPLVERNLILLRALQQLLKRGFSWRDHLASSPGL